MKINFNFLVAPLLLMCANDDALMKSDEELPLIKTVNDRNYSTATPSDDTCLC